MFGALSLMVIGLLLLASNLGYLEFANVRELLSVWWPLILVVLGLSMFISRKPRDK